MSLENYWIQLIDCKKRCIAVYVKGNVMRICSNYYQWFLPYCSALDSLLLENIHTKAAKIILGCFRTSRNAAVLSDLNLILLSNRRELHMLLFFYEVKTGLTSLVLHSFSLLTLGEISAYSFRHANNFQLPFSKCSLVHNGNCYHNTSNYFLVLQHLKTVSPSFTMARNAIFGTCMGQIHLLPHYAVCFALVDSVVVGKRNTWTPARAVQFDLTRPKFSSSNTKKYLAQWKNL